MNLNEGVFYFVIYEGISNVNQRSAFIQKCIFCDVTQ
ncbi:hypothetical protein M140OLGA_1117 [Staphylococcus aureus subsp. aureus 112808A]|nr:hypothetical protein M140OLGA_1117 [Staphylococcus aureus subsp. aureus 112808A]